MTKRHFDLVLAVQRRSAYERVLAKIASIAWWQRQTQQGLKLKDCDSPLLERGVKERAELVELKKMRDGLYKELFANGQLEE